MALEHKRKNGVAQIKTEVMLFILVCGVSFVLFQFGTS